MGPESDSNHTQAAKRAPPEPPAGACSAASKDPRYKTVHCAFFAKGTCTHGAQCTFIHDRSRLPAHLRQASAAQATRKVARPTPRAAVPAGRDEGPPPGTVRVLQVKGNQVKETYAPAAAKPEVAAGGNETTPEDLFFFLQGADGPVEAETVNEWSAKVKQASILGSMLLMWKGPQRWPYGRTLLVT